jgi:Protein of unknown function (DUF1350)
MRESWQEVAGNWVWWPDRPIAIIHFLGGAFVAGAPRLTYGRLLERLGQAGYGIVATPFVNRSLDHEAIATEVLQRCDRALVALEKAGEVRLRYLPLYGLGHSMGCKLHVLIGSLFAVQRAGNMLISFNNFSAGRAIPLMDRVGPMVAPMLASVHRAVPITETLLGKASQTMKSTETVEFTPSPAETLALVRDRYQVQRNLLVKFRQDDLDQSRSLAHLLETRFPDFTTLRKLPGTHLTPIGQDISWQTRREFGPLEAIGQWVQQDVIYRDLNRLSDELLRWLDPAHADWLPAAPP